MLGFQFIKAEPTTYLLAYQKGRIVKQGAGVNLFYFEPTTSMVAVPLQSLMLDFIDQCVTRDFQHVSVQGQVTYRVKEPEKLSGILNYALKANGKAYASNDPEKLNDRIFGIVKVLIQNAIKTLDLKAALLANDEIANALTHGLNEQNEIRSLGLEIIRASIIAIRPNPETAKALEAEARELILRNADEAIFARRNNAVEQERAIRESELDTDIAVEVKKRLIEETKLDAEKSIKGKREELRKKEMETSITIEEMRKEFVAANAANTKTLANAEAQKIAAITDVIKGLDPRLIQSIAAISMEPSQLIAQAFGGLAENASKIGSFNVTSELLENLISER